LNGPYLAERTIPDYPWLTTNIAQQKGRRGEMLARLGELRQHAIVRRGWPDHVAEGIQRIWREREWFYRTLCQLPRVFQHGDAGRRNLMSRTGQNGETETVAIDWGMSGVGAVGEEIAPTVCAPVFWFQGVTPAQLPELEEKVLDGYLQGLQQAGWVGDPRLARLGYLCTAALRYGPLILSTR
jgi:hypothetical protein